MELANIEKLLEAYFEGNTTLREEAQLQEFFASGTVPPHLAHYIPMFSSFAVSRDETFPKEVILPSERNTSAFRKWSVAASVVLLLGIAGFAFFQNNGLSQEEQEALATYNKAKETMMLLSENLNKGASKVTYFDAFAEGAATIQLVDQFNETKNRILK